MRRARTLHRRRQGETPWQNKTSSASTRRPSRVRVAPISVRRTHSSSNIAIRSLPRWASRPAAKETREKPSPNRAPAFGRVSGGGTVRYGGRMAANVLPLFHLFGDPPDDKAFD